MDYGCVPIRRMPTAFAVPTEQAHPITQADRDELYAHFQRKETARRRKAGAAIQGYWERKEDG